LADTVECYFEDGRVAESPDEFEGPEAMWTFDYAYSAIFLLDMPLSSPNTHFLPSNPRLNLSSLIALELLSWTPC
jgi:hypothetical protein